MKVHYLWESRAACGKRGTQGDQHLTTMTNKVTCQKCRITLRYFCGVTGMTYAEAHEYLKEESVRTGLARWSRLKPVARPALNRLPAMGSGRNIDLYTFMVEERVGKRFNTMAPPQDVKPINSDVTFDGEFDGFLRGMKP